jgi:hypothetical protein
LIFERNPLKRLLDNSYMLSEGEMRRCRGVWKDWIPASVGMTDEGLRAEGYKVLRFWDNQVFSNLEGVLETIREALLTPHPNPLPQGERGDTF